MNPEEIATEIGCLVQNTSIAFINNNSIVKGIFDEDLKQYISLRIIKNICKFDIDRQG